MASGTIQQTIGTPRAITSSDTNGLTPYGNSFITKQGHICCLNLMGEITKGISAGSAFLSLPAAYKPKDTMYIMGQWNNTWHDFMLTTSAQIAPYSENIPNGATINLHITYAS